MFLGVLLLSRLCFLPSSCCRLVPSSSAPLRLAYAYAVRACSFVSCSSGAQHKKKRRSRYGRKLPLPSACRASVLVCESTSSLLRFCAVVFFRLPSCFQLALFVLYPSAPFADSSFTRPLSPERERVCGGCSSVGRSPGPGSFRYSLLSLGVASKGADPFLSRGICGTLGLFPLARFFGSPCVCPSGNLPVELSWQPVCDSFRLRNPPNCYPWNPCSVPQMCEVPCGFHIRGNGVITLVLTPFCVGPIPNLSPAV